jgi:hypothetical protein
MFGSLSKMKKINQNNYYLIIAVILALSFMQNIRAADNAVDFMSDLGSAKSMALGGTGVAGLSDPYLNPANLSFKRGYRSEIGSAYLESLLEISRVNFKWQTQLPKDMVFGFGFTNMQVDSIPVVDWDSNDRPYISDYFSDQKTGMLFSIGKKINRDLSFGINVKYYRHILYERIGQGIGLDLGLSFHKYDPLSIGLVLKNIGGTKITWDTGNVDSIARELVLGFKYNFGLRNIGVTVYNDLSFKELGNEINTGLEFKLHKMLALRAGSHAGIMTGGIGINIEDLHFDYAQEFPAHGLGDSKKFEIRYLF